MNINQLKTILELQALQNLSSSNLSLTSDDTTGSLFQELLANALQDQVNNSSNNNLNLNSVLTSVPSTLNTLTLPNLSDIQYEIPTDLDEIIKDAADKYNLPENLLKSVIKQESNFNPEAVSSAGAAGLMQLMPSTAKSLGVTNILDPVENVNGGAKYLRNMLDRFNGDIELALAAYNAGPNNVERYSGIPPFKETQNYVKKITSQLV